MCPDKRTISKQEQKISKLEIKTENYKNTIRDYVEDGRLNTNVDLDYMIDDCKVRNYVLF